MTLNRFCLLLIVVLGALLRFGGMGYGIVRNESYHPDTPKQIRAIDLFLRGERYMHVGARDYDGYPLFTSYLSSRLLSVYWPVAQRVARWTGAQNADTHPSTATLAWTMGVVNALLSTLGILVAWRIGTNVVGAKAGLFAALLLALSPGDIAACHYATGDTGAAFFALLTLFFALRMHRDGRALDYVAAAFCAALAFASKYHALVAAAPVGLAHLLRAEHVKRWHRPASLRLIALLGFSYLAGLFAAIPGLRAEPASMVRDILGFMNYASTFGTPRELMEAGFGAKLAFSLKRNLPILAGMLSLPAVLAMGLGWTHGRRDSRTWMLVAGPLVYFLVGVSMRPMAHPVYHTVLTGPFFLLAARGLADLARAGTLTRALSGTIAALAVLWLGHAGWRETFFFRHSDTRYIARQWSEENIPPTYFYGARVYTFESDYFVRTPEHSEGLFFFTSSPRNQKVPDGFHPLVTFSMEQDSLPFFRNFNLPLMLHQHSTIGTNPLVPIYQRTPSRANLELIPAYAPEFVRSGRIFELGKLDEAERLVVAREPISDVLVVAHADKDEVRCEGEFGGKWFEFRLLPGGVKFQTLEAPRRKLPISATHWFYDLEARTTRGRCRIEFAWTARDKGLALYQAGRPAEALPWIIQAALADKNPTLGALALVVAAETDKVLPASEETALRAMAGPASRLEAKDALARDWRMAANVFDRLPFIVHRAGAFTSESFLQTARWTDEGERIEEFHSDPVARDCSAGMRGLWLEAGVYRLQLMLHADGEIPPEKATARLKLEDHQGVVLATNTVWKDGIELELTLDRPLHQGDLLLEFVPGTSVIVDGLNIHPDALATLRRLWARIPPPRAN